MTYLYCISILAIMHLQFRATFVAAQTQLIVALSNFIASIIQYFTRFQNSFNPLSTNVCHLLGNMYYWNFNRLLTF